MRTIFLLFLLLSLCLVSAKQRVKRDSLLSSLIIQKVACSTCTSVIGNLQALIKNENTQESIKDFIKTTCKALNFQEDYVCDRTVDAFADEIVFVLERTIFSPDEICGAVISDCGDSGRAVGSMWTIPIPGNKPPVKTWPTVQDGQPTMRVLHLSDIHIDTQYAIGSEADCLEGTGLNQFGTYSLCCRNYPNSKNANNPIRQPAGKWGEPYRCDLPWETFENALQHINQTDKFDYILVTGDFVAHDPWDYTVQATTDMINRIEDALKNYFPTTPIYQAVGNHEAVPQDGMAPHSMDGYEQWSPEWLYNLLADRWGPHLTEEAINATRYRASFAIRIKPGLKLISVNSIYCSAYNFFLYINQTDPDDTLQWLVDQLIDSESKGEKVHIISHIPSGLNYCLKAWSWNYYNIINRFENTIAAQFYGHTHNDHFEVFYEDADANKRPTQFNFITPSISTFEFNHPAYRVYTVDGDYPGSSFTVLDAETYSTNVTEANLKDREPVWELEYRTKEALGMSDLSPVSWNNLIDRLESNRTLFEKFNFFYYRNHHDEECASTLSCVQKVTCAMRAARSNDLQNFCPNYNPPSFLQTILG